MDLRNADGTPYTPPAPTPGPWSEFCESGYWWIAQTDADGSPLKPICDSTSISNDGDTRLICAAPDLLAELEEIVKGWKVIEEGYVRGRELTHWEKERLLFARAAIAKVLGQF